MRRTTQRVRLGCLVSSRSVTSSTVVREHDYAVLLFFFCRRRFSPVLLFNLNKRQVQRSTPPCPRRALGIAREKFLEDRCTSFRNRSSLDTRGKLKKRRITGKHGNVRCYGESFPFRIFRARLRERPTQLFIARARAHTHVTGTIMHGIHLRNDEDEDDLI